MDITKIARMGNYAFFNCHNLTYVTLPLGMTSINDGLFYDC